MIMGDKPSFDGLWYKPYGTKKFFFLGSSEKFARAFAKAVLELPSIDNLS